MCWKRRKIGHYRAVQFSEREAVSISPKQSVVGSTPIGLKPQTSNSFWLMLSRACWQTCEEHRLERFFLFIDSFSNFQAPIVQFHAAFAEKMCYNTNASRKSYSLFGKNAGQLLPYQTAVRRNKRGDNNGHHQNQSRSIPA